MLRAALHRTLAATSGGSKSQTTKAASWYTLSGLHSVGSSAAGSTKQHSPVARSFCPGAWKVINAAKSHTDAFGRPAATVLPVRMPPNYFKYVLASGSTTGRIATITHLPPPDARGLHQSRRGFDSPKSLLEWAGLIFIISCSISLVLL